MRYFAYGANLDRDHMRQTAPGAVLVGPAILADHRVTIGRAGYGTLVPAPGEHVPGVVWQLTPADEAALDRFEGVDRGFYIKETREVATASGIEPMMVYVAVDQRPGVASSDYVRRIADAALAAGLPPQHVDALRTLPQDGNASQPWVPPIARTDGAPAVAADDNPA
jgi:hypothetical protein